MQPEELMRLSPRYFHKLMRVCREKQRRSTDVLEIMLAQLTAMVANTGFRGWEEPRKVDEFYITAERRPKSQRMTSKRRQSLREEWRQHLRVICGLPPV